MNFLKKIISDIYTYISKIFNYDYVLIIINVCILLITIIVILDIYNIQLKETKVINKNEKVIYYESFKSSRDALIDKVNNNPIDKHNICKNYTNNTCKMSSYCVLLDDKKCVGGDQYGPTYLTDDNKKVDYNYYTYKNKCYGNCVKKNKMLKN